MTSFRFGRGVALVCIAGLALGACGSSGAKVSQSTGSNNTPGTTGGATKPTSGNNSGPATTASTDPASVAVTESGFSVYKDYDEKSRATAGAVIKNSGKSDVSYFQVVFSFMDAADKPVGTQTAYVQAIAAGGVAYAQVGSVELTGEAAKVTVAAVVRKQMGSKGRVVPVTVSGVAPEQYGDGTEVNGTAKNDTKDVVDSVQLDCVLRSGKKIVGGASGYLDTMVPGASITWKARGYVDADAAECSAASSK